MKLTEHFYTQEFNCKCGCNEPHAVDFSLLMILEEVREHFGGHFVTVNSGYRCKWHNKAVGGSKDSMHLLGLAADIAIEHVAPYAVWEYLQNKYSDSLGLGNYRSFTHIDTRPNKARWGLK